MQYVQSFEEFLLFADEAHSAQSDGVLYVSQTDIANQDFYLGDEDTSRANIRQELSMLLETAAGSAYFEYTFIQPLDLEDVNEQLLDVYRLFPKVVVDKAEIDQKLKDMQNS